MSLVKASLWTASSIAVKILSGLLIIKLLAVSFGPQGLGLASNYRQLITVLGVMAGAGIFNGVTRYIAEYQDQPQTLKQLTGTATAFVSTASLVIALVLLLAARPISQALFASDDYQWVIRVLAFVQIGIGWANLLQAQLKGFRDARGNALVVIIGCLVGVPGYLLCWWLGGYSGALIGLATVPALLLLPALPLLLNRTSLQLSMFRPAWDWTLAKALSRYTMMTLITACCLPLAWIIMRHQLATVTGWQQVGLWLAMTSISDAYLQFITATFSVWLLPTLAKLKDKTAIAQEIVRALRFVLPAVAVISLVLWLLRDAIILLLFSEQFRDTRGLFSWQLIGDLCKVGAYVFGYLVIARGSLRYYFLTEISQLILLLVSANWLIPLHGVVGAVQAYCLTYCSYFLLCASAFIVWYRK